MDDAVSRETWEGWRCEVEQLTDQTAVLNTYKGDNLIYTERMPSRVARWHAEAHNDRAALEAEVAELKAWNADSSGYWNLVAELEADLAKIKADWKTNNDRWNEALTTEHERAEELARKLDAELLRRDTERPIWKKQLQAERERAEKAEALLVGLSLDAEAVRFRPEHKGPYKHPSDWTESDRDMVREYWRNY
jgi:septal ring factor EnvC (AmiA/AmiB activator)